MAELKLKEVSKSFGSVEVVRRVNLSVDDGEFVVFVGPSGCGKSTLLRMIAGLEKVGDGEIRIVWEVGEPVNIGNLAIEEIAHEE